MGDVRRTLIYRKRKGSAGVRRTAASPISQDREKDKDPEREEAMRTEPLRHIVAPFLFNELGLWGGCLKRSAAVVPAFLNDPVRLKPFAVFPSRRGPKWTEGPAPIVVETVRRLPIPQCSARILQCTTGAMPSVVSTAHHVRGRLVRHCYGIEAACLANGQGPEQRLAIPHLENPL